ncbi:terpene synthase family protein [Nostoc sp.]|uniref:terpene synthase family protein n=1 Tax=Nostoc sp. TaxID=1180 RepID=UPI002FEEED26
MEGYTLPNLYYPFPSHLNKYDTELEQYAIEWVKKVNLLANESDYQRFCKIKLYRLAAGAYPNSQLEELKIVNDWLSWIFLWDDYIESTCLKEQPELLQVLHTSFIEVLNGRSLNSRNINNKDLQFVYAVSNLRQRMMLTINPNCLQRFISTLEDFLKACVWEVTNLMQGHIPDLETYLVMRSFTVGAYPFFELFELVAKIEISEEVRTYPTVKSLTRMANNILAWSNDIFSFSKELKRGDFHNLVILLQHQHQLSLEEAIQQAVDLHNQEVQNFINLEQSLPCFGTEVNTELKRYTSFLCSWMRSNLDWSYLSHRYQTKELIAVT